MKKKYQNDALKVSQIITENLVKELKLQFPNKKFLVYLDCDFNEHTIIRFHQNWTNELPYYDINDFPTIKVYSVGI